ncbi:Monocarboxylate transporter 12 [Holothuria leucospilota]|uniref:Monocarboxylate transporter 12 n=1 Tax=Holothuria leucospilota TaxID=206669 RepID=A0A9Q0YE00_HOLLE|nr:Monocarboxylate transporter 12 [Holothuria leucospilota]
MNCDLNRSFQNFRKLRNFKCFFFSAGVGGSALDGLSYRFLGISGGFLFGLGFVCHGAFGHKLWHLFVNMTLAAIGGGLLHFALFMSYIEHFQDKFSVAFSTRELSTYVGVSVMPPLMEVLRSSYGLQGSYLIFGAIAWNCVVCGLLLKSPPNQTSTRSVCEELKFLLRKINCCYLDNYKEPYSNEGVAKRLQIQLWNLANIFSLAPAIKHPRFAVFLLIHSLFYYTFTAWALFLVPFGISIGFSATVAVYLSTAGGVGGFVGKLLAIAVFHFEKMNSLTGALIPSLICCVGLTGYIFTTDYLFLLLYSSLCGFALAFADSALNGMIPRYLCENHLKQGSAISYLFGGVFMQLGGVLSGKNFLIFVLSSQGREISRPRAMYGPQEHFDPAHETVQKCSFFNI